MSKNKTLVEKICKSKETTKIIVTINCNKSLLKGDVIKAMSDEKPIKKINNKNKHKIACIWKKNKEKNIKYIPPTKGIFFSPENFWCFSPE